MKEYLSIDNAKYYVKYLKNKTLLTLSTILL
jgi:hypothetical protein